MTSRQWIERGSGKSVYNKLWKRLQELKFYEFADEVSASWIATRIKRIGNSRKSIFQEQLGYIDGGSETLVEAMADDIRRKGGESIYVRRPNVSSWTMIVSRPCVPVAATMLPMR